MNFQDLVHIENADKYLDYAFSKAKDKADLARTKKYKDRLTKSQQIEVIRIAGVEGVLLKHLEKILLSFPNIDDLDEFYNELVKITIEYPDLKRALGAVRWAIDKIRFFTSDYTSKIHKCKEVEKINAYRREYYGRVSSIMKQIKNRLEFLENARRTMKAFPTIKTSVPTVAIAGFPNVGKTTLLYKLTGSKPEINEYAFTTKSINVSYIKDGSLKIQFLDTPGTLNRLNKMNYIEKMAYLAIKLVSNRILYVFDLTMSYPIDDQILLYERMKEFGLPIDIYYSKNDLVPDDVIQFHKKYHGYDNARDVKKHYLKVFKITKSAKQ